MHPDNPDLQAQLDRVLANVGDDDECLVYADMLMEVGDPRGELIVLQLLEEPNAQQKRRIAEFIRKHGRALAGPLDKLMETKKRRFNRGFISACTSSTRRHALPELLTYPIATCLTRLTVGCPEESDLEPVARLGRLEHLQLRETKVSDLGPLAGLANLEHLGLYGTQVSQLTPLASLAKLATLQLGRTRVFDLTPLAGLAKLVTLQLEETDVSDLGPLAGLTRLVSLQLEDTQVSDLRPLAALTHLEQLNLSHTLVHDLAPLAKLRQLRALDLAGTRLNSLEGLSRLTNLERVDLGEAQVSPRQVEMLKSVLPKADIVHWVM